MPKTPARRLLIAVSLTLTLFASGNLLTVPASAAPAPPNLRVADFDGNGATEPSLYRAAQGVWYVQGGPAVSWGGSQFDRPVAADYDGGGATDMAVYRASTGTWYVRNQFQFSWGGDPTDVPVPGNYDAIAGADPAVYRAATATWFVNRRRGLPSDISQDQWGGDPSDIPVPGDYDGDGDTDIAVYRAATGYWYVKNQPLLEGRWGGDPTDVPVPGDYDGNGTTDIAVYRAATGYWYVKNQPSLEGRWGGDPTDVPVPGDYNGNASTDLAVYRRRTGRWYVKNFLETAWGGDFTDKALPLGNSVQGSFAVVTPYPITDDADWRSTAAYYRGMQNLGGLTEDPSWSDGAAKHSKYVIENNIFGTGGNPHTETVGADFYTPEGKLAAENGNVAWRSGFPTVDCDNRTFVEAWITGPFHALGILDPRLIASGFGSYQKGNECAATMDVLRGDNGPAPTEPVRWPGDKTTVPLRTFPGFESPPPETSCPGYTAPTGLGILLQLPTNPNAAITVDLSRNGTAIATGDRCVFDGNTYVNSNSGVQTTGRNVLLARNAIVILPKNALIAGSIYSVRVRTGVYDVSWSFKAA